MPFNAIDDEGNYLSCPECGSSHLNREGYKRLRDGENKQRWKCQACAYKTIYPARNSKDTIVENVRLSKQKQSYQDRSRVERKSFREYARLENALTELNSKLIKRLEYMIYRAKQIKINVETIDPELIDLVTRQILCLQVDDDEILSEQLYIKILEWIQKRFGDTARISHLNEHELTTIKLQENHENHETLH